MKSTILFLFAFVLTLSSFAQVPQKFNYQAVVRNNTGVIVTNQNIAVKAEILDSNTTNILYSETHTVTTNAQGLFALQVGGGSVKSGVFANIDWSAGNRYIRTSVDLAGGTNFQLIGTSQLLSVPYALQAKNIPISRVGNSDSIYFGDKLLIIPGVKVVNTTPDITTGLVAYYPFNGNANDESGNANNGTVIGATLTTDRFGNSNGAYIFDSDSQNIKLSNLHQNNILNYSVFGWFKIDPILFGNGGGTIFAGNTPLSSPAGLRFALHGPKATQWSVEDGWNTNGILGSNNNITYNDNKWHSFTVTFSSNTGLIDATSFNIYIEGYKISSITFKQNWPTGSGFSQGFNVYAPINNNTMPVILGNHNGFTDCFKGCLDDIRIYNRALTQEEITYLDTH
jgi:hypothetical protein